MTATLPAIRAAEKILEIIVNTPDEEIDEALNKIATAAGTWGLLWGLDNINRSKLDLDFYELKGEVLRMISKIKKDRRFEVAEFVVIMKRAKELHENDQRQKKPART